MAAVSLKDVISGRGSGSSKHQGNKRYIRIVDALYNRYQTAQRKASHETVAAIFAEVYQLVCSTYSGKFLKYDKEIGDWSELTHKEALRKIATAFRTRKQQYERLASKKSKGSSLFCSQRLARIRAKEQGTSKSSVANIRPERQKNQATPFVDGTFPMQRLARTRSQEPAKVPCSHDSGLYIDTENSIDDNIANSQTTLCTTVSDDPSSFSSDEETGSVGYQPYGKPEAVHSSIIDLDEADTVKFVMGDMSRISDNTDGAQTASTSGIPQCNEFPWFEPIFTSQEKEDPRINFPYTFATDAPEAGYSRFNLELVTDEESHGAAGSEVHDNSFSHELDKEFSASARDATLFLFNPEVSDIEHAWNCFFSSELEQSPVQLS